MQRPGTIFARLFFALALIVQIIAPVASSVAMVSAATDPLAGIAICAADFGSSERHDGSAPLTDRLGRACDLCQLVSGGGFAPPVDTPAVTTPSTDVRITEWVLRVEPVVTARLLDRIRGRAPPVFS